MATTAKQVSLLGASIEIQKYSSAGVLDTKKASLCAADSISVKPGSAEKKDVSTMCDAITGAKSYTYGLPDPGDVSISFPIFDITQDGIKLWHELPVNDKAKITITFANGMKIEMDVRKGAHMGFDLNKDSEFKSSLDAALVGTVQITPPTGG